VANPLGVRLALPFALFVGVAEVVRNWGDWGFWPFWLVDYIAATLLIWGWHTARRRKPGAASLLAGAWGFTCAMFYMSFFGHLEDLERPDHGPLAPRPLTAIIGILFGLTVLGLVSSIRNARRDVTPNGTER